MWDPNNEPRSIKTKELHGFISDNDVHYKNKQDGSANIVCSSLVVFHIYMYMVYKQISWSACLRQIVIKKPGIIDSVCGDGNLPHVCTSSTSDTKNLKNISATQHKG